MRKEKKINFITFEGIDGSGKSTILKELSKIIIDLKITKEIFITREPGGTPLAEKIREVIIKNEMLPYTEALLYAASRCEHVNNVIIPAIKRNAIVFCDRYVESSICYQGFMKGLGEKNIKFINKLATQDTKPDLIFFLNVSIQTSNERMNTNRKDSMDRFDKMENNYKKILIDAYKKILSKNKNVIFIDAEKSINEIIDEIINHLKLKRVI